MSESANTHCPYCAMQCGMVVFHEANAWKVDARDFPTNKGGMCRKGWTSAELLEHPERLLNPLIRRNGELEEASWDEALDLIVSRFQTLQAESGADAVALFGGGGLTNEKAYLLGKFARVALKTSQIDYNGRYCMASAAGAGIRAFGLDRGLPFPLEDIARADTVILVGANIAETMPPIMQWFEKLRENGGKLIVVDPRVTSTASNADYHFQVTPGTDLLLALGLLHVAIEENLVDTEFVAHRTNNWECTREIALRYWPHFVESQTGVDEDQMREVVRLLASGNTIILSARGAEQHAHGTDTVSAWINLALALGKFGKPFNGYGTLTGQGNGQGGREHGQKADQLPGYRKIDNPQHRSEVAAHWGISPNELPKAGRSAVELLDSLGTQNGPRALWVMGSNLVVSSPRAKRIEEKLKSLDFLVVSDLFLSETAEFADVVLPATQWAEEEGTMTNLEGRVLKRNRAKEPPENAWSDTKILAAVAARLGCADKFPSEPRQIWNELRRVTKGAPADYSGISYEEIEKQDGVFWPCPDEKIGEGGTKRMFLDGTFHPDKKARFQPVEFWGLPEEPDEEFPLFFTTGRTMSQYQSGNQTRRVRELNAIVGPPYVEMHPDLARELNLKNGELIRVVSRRGEVAAKARFSEGIRPDTIFMPFHWGGKACANALTIPALDPTSKMPEFKVCAARIEKTEVGIRETEVQASTSVF